jgi:hypothetical protein
MDDSASAAELSSVLVWKDSRMLFRFPQEDRNEMRRIAVMSDQPAETKEVLFIMGVLIICG